MFIGGDFLKNLVNFRSVWLRGRYGGGKTALSVALAHWLYDNGYVDNIYANIPVLGQAEPTPDDLLNSAMIFDEAWLFLDARTFARNDTQTFGAFLRKFNLFMLLPSVHSIDKRFRFLHIQRVLDLSGFFLPVWVYRWMLNTGYDKADTGIFYWIRPSEVFGKYDSDATPTSSWGMLPAIRAKIDSLRDGDLDVYPGSEVQDWHYSQGFAAPDQDVGYGAPSMPASEPSMGSYPE